MGIITFIFRHKIISGFLGIIIFAIFAYLKDQNTRIENQRDLYNSYNSGSNMADAYNRHNNRVAKNAQDENRMSVGVFICFAWIVIGLIQYFL